jgi:hypothetical protein
MRTTREDLDSWKADWRWLRDGLFTAMFVVGLFVITMGGALTLAYVVDMVTR